MSDQTPDPTPAGWQVAMTEAAQLAQTGDLAASAEAFRAILLTDVPPAAQAMACCNIAMLLRQTEQIDEAVVWYDEAAERDPELGILNALSDKAAMLHGAGRTEESVAALERLLSQPHLTGEARATVEHNLELVRSAG